MFSDATYFENPNFTGQAKCDLAVDPRNKIKEILGIQEKIRDEQN